jgi:hypothetical protein
MRLHRARAESAREIGFVGALAAASCARQKCLAIFERVALAFKLRKWEQAPRHAGSRNFAKSFWFCRRRGQNR